MSEKFFRWNTLLLQYVKRDWLKIILWIFGVGLFSAAFVPAFEEIAEGEGLVGLYETLKNPAMISMIGPTPVTSAHEYTLGAMYSHEMLLFCALCSMIVSGLHVISHTRKEEELGLVELLRSFQVGRQANALATVIESLLINSLLILFITAVMYFLGDNTITAQGSILFGGSIGIAGLLGTGIALIMAQIMPTSASATGSTLGIIGILYIIRGVTDTMNVGLSIYNPLGWTYLTYPFTENNWGYVMLALFFSFVFIVMAFVLEGARDLGSGFIPEREGRSSAHKSLLSVPGLLLLLNRGMIISWFVALAVLGAAYGSIYGDMNTFLESNEMMKRMFTHSGVSIEESFTATIIMVMISLVTILPIAILNRLFSEERHSRLNQLLSTAVTRGQLYWSTICLAISASILGILFAVGTLAITAIVAMGDQFTMVMTDFLAAGYNYLPSIVFLISLAALVLGFIPKWGKFVYAYLAYCFVLNYFADLLQLPDWLTATAIQSWIPHMPMQDFDAGITLTITLISIVLLFIGFYGYRNRDMVEEV